MFFSASKEHADCVEEVWQPIWQQKEETPEVAEPPAKRPKPAEPAEKSKDDDDKGNNTS